MTEPETAASHASLIAARTSDRTMPPWPPGPRSAPMLNQRNLSDEQIATLARWAEAGAPMGDRARAAPIAPPSQTFGAPEITADIGVDYAPDTALTDDYRCFGVDLQLGQRRMATAYRILPGNAQTVHHVVVALFAGGDRGALEALDARSPERPGWPCLGTVVPGDSKLRPTGILGGWVPGAGPVKIRPGAGVLLEAGTLAVLQVHYNLHGGTGADRTRLEIALAHPGLTDSLQALYTVPVAKWRLFIPAGEKDVVQERALPAKDWLGGHFFPDGEAYIDSVLGHMHMLGTRITLEQTTGAGTVTLLDIPRWDFNWQGSYQLATPLRLAETDLLSIRCVFDNSAERREQMGFTRPMSDVTWGEGTYDEMCFGYVTVSDGLPGAR